MSIQSCLFNTAFVKSNGLTFLVPDSLRNVLLLRFVRPEIDPDWGFSNSLVRPDYRDTSVIGYRKNPNTNEIDFILSADKKNSGTEEVYLYEMLKLLEQENTPSISFSYNHLGNDKKANC